MIGQDSEDTAPAWPDRSLTSLDPFEQERFLRAIESATTVRRRHQLYLWSQGALQGVLPHSLLICTLREPTTGSLLADRFSTIPFSDEQFEQVCAGGEGLLARMTSAWVADGGRPMILSASDSRVRGIGEIPSLRSGGTVAMHGTFDPSGAPGSGFLFCDVNAMPQDRCAYLLELLVPYLHGALVRVSIDPQGETMIPFTRGTLTAREIDILRCVQRGMSNTDIGRTLEISPLTVKNHVQKVLRKLGVANRGQAVVKATLTRTIPPLTRGGD